MPAYRTFQKEIVTNQFTLIVAILLSAAGWLLAFLLNPVAGITETIGAFVLHGIIGYLLIELNNSCAIIRLRASVQTSVYLLLVTACNDLHCLYTGSILTLLVLLGIFIFFATYQNYSSAGYLMHVFLLLGFCSLSRPLFIYLTPLFWIGAYSFRTLNARSFVASLLGLSLPFMGQSAYLLYTGQSAEILHMLTAPVSMLVAPHYTTTAALILLYVGVWFVAAASYCLQSGYSEKIRIRCYLHFLIQVCLVALLLMTLQPQSLTDLLPTTLMVVSILIGHFVSATNSRWSNLFFIAMLLGLAALYTFTIWMG